MENPDKLKRAFEKFEKALRKYKEAVKSAKFRRLLQEEVLLEVTAKRFEYTFETLWKVLKEYLRSKGVDSYAPMDCFRSAFKLGLIDEADEALFVDIVDNRNEIVHVYDLEEAEEICRFVGSMRVLSVFENIRKKLKQKI